MGDLDDDSFWVRPFQIMEWSNEASLALIEEYRKQSVLWDVTHPSYTSKSQKQEAWDSIACNMQLDVQEVKQKMNSLLGSFRREKSKMRKNRESSNGQASGYCPKWFAFEKMQFLLRDEEADSIGGKFDEEDDFILDELGCVSQEFAEGKQKSSSSSAPPLKRAKKLLKPMPDPLIDDLSIFQPQDEYSAFGQYIACKLRKFDPRTRAFVERAINNVLFEADMGKYDQMTSPFGANQLNWNASQANELANLTPTSTSFNGLTENAATL